MRLLFTAVALTVFAVPALGGERLTVDPQVGNNTFSAVFDAPVGERINAVSSQVSCDLSVDDSGATVSGSCSVPLTSVMVDNEPTKTDHFQQWSTNKKVEPKDCQLEAKLARIKLTPALSEKSPSKFSGEVTFTICGRTKVGGGDEKISGQAMFLAGRDVKTWRVRARVDSFNRESYQIGPKWTDGWLSRVQQLAPVVAATGQIELSLFAKQKAKP